MAKRYLSIMVRIDAEWPEGSADIDDAINRLLLPLWKVAHAEVVLGFEPAKRPRFVPREATH